MTDEEIANIRLIAAKTGREPMRCSCEEDSVFDDVELEWNEDDTLRIIEDFPGSKPTVKQKLAAVQMLYDFLVVRQTTPLNPAHSVRGPKYVVKKGKTPVWSRDFQ